MNETYPYPYSAAEARKRNELSLWRESYKANIACRNAIEDAIRQNFDGMNLQTDCLKAVLDEYGFQRGVVGEVRMFEGEAGQGLQLREAIFFELHRVVIVEIVDADDRMPLGDQAFGKVESGRAGWLRQFLPQGGAGVKSLWRGALCR